MRRAHGGTLPRLRRAGALRALQATLGADLYAVRSEYDRQCDERECWLSTALHELLPPSVVELVEKRPPTMSHDAVDYVLGVGAYDGHLHANPKRLHDAARSVALQWAPDGTRTVRAVVRRAVVLGAGFRDDDALCVLCGNACIGRGHSDRYEGCQGGWVTSCKRHAFEDDGDIDTLYGCDICVHDTYRMINDRHERVLMRCGCIFSIDAWFRMND
jgi:hypothetical protein